MQEGEQRMELQGAYLWTCIVDRHLRAMGRMYCSHNAGLGYPIKIVFRKPLKRAGDCGLVVESFLVCIKLRVQPLVR